jgi:hypothetical protein
VQLTPGRLDPALPLLWRAPGVLQVGLNPERAVAVSGVSPRLPGLLRGTASSDDPADARACHLLEAAGTLAARPPTQRWRQAWVQVVGDGPVATQVVDHLRDAGVGQVSRVGEASTSGADLVVLAPAAGRGMEHGQALVGSTVVHLWAHLRDGCAVVGPLVVPGATSCQRCHDLHRTDADPAWPTLALAWEQQPAPPASTESVHVLVAAAARQSMAWLRGTRPASLGSTLEEQPDGQLVRVPFSVHPGCGCGWGRDSAQRADAAVESSRDIQ